MKLINVKVLSDILSVKPKTIYYLVHKKAIPFIRIGKLVRFDKKEIQTWLENKKNAEVGGNPDES